MQFISLEVKGSRDPNFYNIRDGVRAIKDLSEGLNYINKVIIVGNAPQCATVKLVKKWTTYEADPVYSALTNSEIKAIKLCGMNKRWVFNVEQHRDDLIANGTLSICGNFVFEKLRYRGTQLLMPEKKGVTDTPF